MIWISPGYNVKLPLLLLSLLLSCHGFCCELKVAVREFPPYAIKTADKQWRGIDIQLFEALFSRQPCHLQFVEAAFGESLLLLENGQIDAMSQLSITEPRQQKLYFIGPVRHEKLTLVSSKDVPESIRSLDDIGRLPYVWAKRKGTYIGEEFQRRYDHDPDFSNKFIAVDNTIPRIELVRRKRIVGFFDEAKFNEYSLTHSKKYQQMKLHPLTIDNGVVYIGLSKKTMSEAQAQALNERLTQLLAQQTQ